MSNKKIVIEYDIEHVSVGTHSATGYIAILQGERPVPYNTIILKIYNMTTVSNLKMLKAFVEDLIYLETKGVEIELLNHHE